MEKTKVTLKGLALTALAIISPSIIGAVFGAFSGLIVGLAFEQSILLFFEKFGLSGLEVWEIGCALGFVGSFFKSHQFNTEN